MTRLADQIRPSQPAGSGTGEHNPAANSPAEVWAERPVPGGANKPVPRVFPIAGGEVRIEPAGTRVNVTILTGRGLRNRLTASFSPDDAERLFQHGLDVVPLARAQRQAKGA